jgi:hypothetical protein
LIIDGSSFEQAVKATTTKTITPITIVLFLFTLQNYPCPTLPAAEFGKMQLRIEEISRPIGDHVDFPAKPTVSKGFMIFFAALR